MHSPAIPATPLPGTAGRNAFGDQLKGFLILLVTWGHSIQFFCNGSAYSDPFFRFIYCFHMPLFMAISGYFSFIALKRLGWLQGLARRFRQIALPLIAWSTVWSVAIFILCLITIPEAGLNWATRLPADIVGHCLYGFWFLLAVLGSTFVILTLRTFKSDNAIGLLACSLLFMAAPEYQSFDLYKYVLPFFCAGYWIARNGITLQPSVRNFAIAFILAATGLFLWTDNTYTYVSGAALTRENSVNLIVRYSTGASMSVAMCLLACKFLPHTLPALLTRWGRHSLEIYMMQIVFFEILQRRLQIPGSFWSSLAMLPAAMLLNELFSRIGQVLEWHPLTSAVFLGRTCPPPASPPVLSSLRATY